MRLSPHFVAIVLSILLPRQAAAIEPLKLVSNEIAPFASTDPATKAIVGITYDMLAEAARRAELPCKTDTYPWARAYWMAQNEADTCVYPTIRLAQRESLFQWVGPLSKSTWVLYARADFRKRVAGLADVKKYRVGGLLQDGPSVFLTAQGVNVEMVGTNELNFNKLIAGRIDLWATGYFNGRQEAAKANRANIKPVYVIQEVEHYLACNLSVPAQSIRSMNHAVATMWQDGWMKRINDSYAKAPN